MRADLHWFDVSIVVELIRIGLTVPCSRSYDNIVILNVAIVSVLDGRADGAVAFALDSCLAGISDRLVKAVPFCQL